jgi:SWI/SNF-related matrix-associated actin-dependent regulator of chromatin subfamily A member 5
LKSSVGCGKGEAVSTIYGKDPTLADVSRPKKEVLYHQLNCQVCAVDDDDLKLCQNCPRSYHLHCLPPKYQTPRSFAQFVCPQHRCCNCDANTQEAGGMLYRCRFCEKAYCEGCMDFDQAILVSNTTLEHRMLKFPEAQNAFYIECPACIFKFGPPRLPKDVVVAEASGDIEKLEGGQVRSGQMSTGDTSLTHASTAVAPMDIDAPVDLDENKENISVGPNKRKNTLEDSSTSKKKRHE